MHVCVMQIILLIIYQSGGNLESSVVTSYQIIRVLRLVRFMSLLKRLYATAVAASSAMLPGLNVSHHLAAPFIVLSGGRLAGRADLLCATMAEFHFDFCCLQITHAEANFFNLIYGGSVLASFLACLW